MSLLDCHNYKDSRHPRVAIFFYRKRGDTMSDNWVVQNLQRALDTWNEKLAEIWTLLLQSPEEFKNGRIWTVILDIHSDRNRTAGAVFSCGNHEDLRQHS